MLTWEISIYSLLTAGETFPQVAPAPTHRIDANIENDAQHDNGQVTSYNCIVADLNAIIDVT
jgi:hypothetical protein